MPSLSIAALAGADLREIRRYSEAAHGPKAMATYIAGLRQTFQKIVDRPLLGRPEDDLEPGLRSLSFRSHRIYYRTHEAGVLVVRVMHHARDIRLAFAQ